ncbi:hypothetical protein B4N89_14310 [Embleya scabrispora]|uniref:Uncharacterized protein n=2 Tax=Embleya scabrispora TaxID=159449 RepID=A0A1T3NYW7_9ACTN|nr:hypothetical protein B4N89_14310 [Embleya scabrispora]
MSVPPGPLDTPPWGNAHRTANERRALLYRVLADAGVELGAYDRLMVDWLGDWDNPTVLTVASLIARAGAPTEQGS